MPCLSLAVSSMSCDEDCTIEDYTVQLAAWAAGALSGTPGLAWPDESIEECGTVEKAAWAGTVSGTPGPSWPTTFLIHCRTNEDCGTAGMAACGAVANIEA